MKCATLLAKDKPLSMQEDEQRQTLYYCQLQLMAWKHKLTSFQQPCKIQKKKWLYLYAVSLL